MMSFFRFIKKGLDFQVEKVAIKKWRKKSIPNKEKLFSFFFNLKSFFEMIFDF